MSRCLLLTAGMLSGRGRRLSVLLCHPLTLQTAVDVGQLTLGQVKYGAGLC